MPVIWQDAMSTGNIIIDDEHKYLFCLINSVEIALKLDDNARIMKMLVDQLEEYTTDHFRREERVQIKIRYPGYLEHKLEHQKILDEIAELKVRLFSATDEVADPPSVTSAEQAPSAEAVDSAEGAATAEVEDYDENAKQEAASDVSDIPAKAKAAEMTDKETPVKDSISTQTDDDIVGLLRGWILGHVLKTDMKMKKHLAQYPTNFT